MRWGKFGDGRGGKTSFSSSTSFFVRRFFAAGLATAVESSASSFFTAGVSGSDLTARFVRAVLVDARRLLWLVSRCYLIRSLLAPASLSIQMPSPPD